MCDMDTAPPISFSLDERADRRVLTITAPEAAREAADLLFEQSEARRTPTEASACNCKSECEA
jgi:hypothetical protein